MEAPAEIDYEILDVSRLEANTWKLRPLLEEVRVLVREIYRDDPKWLQMFDSENATVEDFINIFYRLPITIFLARESIKGRVLGIMGIETERGEEALISQYLKVFSNVHVAWVSIAPDYRGGEIMRNFYRMLMEHIRRNFNLTTDGMVLSLNIHGVADYERRLRIFRACGFKKAGEIGELTPDLQFMYKIIGNLDGRPSSG